MDVFNACRIRKDSSIGSRGPSEARPSEKGEKKIIESERFIFVSRLRLPLGTLMSFAILSA